MRKTLLIIQREYLSRVKKRSFIVMTFLVPILFIGMYALLGYMMMNQEKLSEEQKVLVVDESNSLISALQNSPALIFNFSNNTYQSEKQNFKNSTYDYLLYIPQKGINYQLYCQDKPSVNIIKQIEGQIREIRRNEQLKALGINMETIARAGTDFKLETIEITDAGTEQQSSSYVAYGVGFLCAFLIYMSLFIYGVQVMRGVIEEKTNRIIEVIVSSVKPFQLMLGKIIGVGLVGLTQFVLWILLCGSIASTAAYYFSAELGNQTKGVLTILTMLDEIPMTYTIGTFLFYFLFGFFLYSSIFAAVGSAVDSETETQQFMLPITMPLIFTFILCINFVINNPQSKLAFWLSVIPFTSPIAMMIRIPFGVPIGELITSMILLLLGFMAITWVAARIYRVGILMYGKKASYKELFKWFRYKE